ncbi:putative sulfate exporter family transporter [cf. Phormidesmis sp. LEGE 11477]|nr:putative sulfate exporter family transporter [cf. Phormidesmis sp. LEGE 11477]
MLSRLLYHSVTLTFNLQQLIFLGLAFVCLTPLITAPLALTLGLAIALTVRNPFPQVSKQISRQVLKGCVVLLGFGMDLAIVLKVGRSSALFSILTIGMTLLLGQWLGTRLKISHKISILISSGTAICGGSAIAAISTVIGAAEQEISIAMGTVFLLNAVGLYLFPLLGHTFHLSAEQFGLWAGVAIHDISSVVGAASYFGVEALNTATAVKLARSLWILPVSLLFSRLIRPHDTATRSGEFSQPVQVPWFICLFLLASVARSVIPAIADWSPTITQFSKIGLKLALFLIGAGLSAKTLKSVGWKPILQGVVLWIIVSLCSLGIILFLGLTH